MPYSFLNSVISKIMLRLTKHKCAMSFLKEHASAKGLNTISDIPVAKALYNLSRHENARLDNWIED